MTAEIEKIIIKNIKVKFTNKFTKKSKLMQRLKAASWDDINFCFQFCNEVVYPTDYDFILD